MNEAAIHDLRTWIRNADDTRYGKHIFEAVAESPRTAVTDLYTPLREARERCPVQPYGQSQLAGLEDFVTMPLFTERRLFSLLGFAEVKHGFAETATFSSAIHNETIGQVWGETLLGMDADEHRLYRALIAQAFRPKSLERWNVEVIAPVVGGLVDRFADRGRAELVSDFTLLFPVYVIAEMLGLPRNDVPKFMSWAADTVAIFHDPETAFAASKALAEYLSEQIDIRRGVESDNDMIGMLLNAEIDGERLSDQDIINFLRILLPAGAETTFHSTSNLLFALLTQPDQKAALYEDRSLTKRAIEEALRWEPPLTSVNRITTTSVEVDGVSIPRGSIVACNIGAANRDPSRWEDPDRYDLHRPPQGHLAFAFGPHTCVGIHLARLEMEAALAELLSRLPDMRLDPDEDYPEIRGIGFRAPLKLPVVFTPTSTADPAHTKNLGDGV